MSWHEVGKQENGNKGKPRTARDQCKWKHINRMIGLRKRREKKDKQKTMNDGQRTSRGGGVVGEVDIKFQAPSAIYS